jgi:hypothetical protein
MYQKLILQSKIFAIQKELIKEVKQDLQLTKINEEDER